MPVEGISMTTVFSLIAVGLAMALATYIGGYYLRPIFEIDALIASVAYDIATMHDLAYTLPGEVTIRYFGPSACKWNLNKPSNDLSAFYCVDPSSVLLKSVSVNKQYLLVYDDIYLKHDSSNKDLTNWLFERMGDSDISQAIGYPRIAYLTIEIPFYNRRVSAQTDYESGKISYGSLAIAPFAASYSDEAMTAAQTPYDVKIQDHSFIVEKRKVGNYYYTISDWDKSPQEASLFFDYLTGVYSGTICDNSTILQEANYSLPSYSVPIADASTGDSLMLSRGHKIKAYNTGIPLDKFYGSWSFDNGLQSIFPGNAFISNNAALAEGLYGKAYHFNGINSYLTMSIPEFAKQNPFSIAFWIKADEIKQSHLLSDGVGMNIIMNPSGISFCTGISPSNDACASSITNMIKNRWYHILAVFNGTHNLLYIDSQLKAIQASGSIINPNAQMTLGKHHSLSSSYFNGMIDDFKIFNEALNAGDVNEIYSSFPSNTICSESIKLTRDEKQLYSELFEYWNFSNTYISRLSNAEFAQSTEIGFIKYEENSLKFEEIAFSGDAYNCPPQQLCHAAYHLSSSTKPIFYDFSIAFWIKPSSLGRSQYILSTNKNCSAPCEEITGYSIGINEEDKLFFHFANSYENQDLLLSNKNIISSEWQHIIVSFNQGTAKIYINGELDSEKTSHSTYIAEPFYNLTLASSGDTSILSNRYLGLFKELRIYNKELSETQAIYVKENPDKLTSDPFFEDFIINDYAKDYCFNIDELMQKNPCNNVNAVFISKDFARIINKETNFYAGFNSCIQPYLIYGNESKTLTINAISKDYNLIAGGCI